MCSLSAKIVLYFSICKLIRVFFNALFIIHYSLAKRSPFSEAFTRINLNDNANANANNPSSLIRINDNANDNANNPSSFIPHPSSSINPFFAGKADVHILSHNVGVGISCLEAHELRDGSLYGAVVSADDACLL